MGNTKKIKTVILICGKASSGKSTLAISIVSEINNRVNEVRAIPMNNGLGVKRLAIEQFDWNGLKDKRGRQLLLDITNSGYNYDPLFWEKKTIKEFFLRKERAHHNLDTLVIPDWRYAQTKDFFEIHAERVITIRVNRPNQEIGTHENDKSETDFENFKVDNEVYNDVDNISTIKAVAEYIINKYDLDLK